MRSHGTRLRRPVGQSKQGVVLRHKRDGADTQPSVATAPDAADSVRLPAHKEA